MKYKATIGVTYRLSKKEGKMICKATIGVTYRLGKKEGKMMYKATIGVTYRLSKIVRGYSQGRAGFKAPPVYTPLRYIRQAMRLG